jgi:hypothetical protein
MRLGLFCAAALLPAAPSARAGLTFELDIYRNNHGQFYNFYSPLSTNATPPDLQLGTYVVSSPQWPASGSTRAYAMTTNGFNIISGQETGYSDFDSAMRQITNGAWTLLFTNATTSNLYTFTVSAPAMTSNMLPATIITFPANGALDIPNRPAFTWQGPTNWPVNTTNTYVRNYDSSFFEYAILPAAQTNWTLSTSIPNGLNCAFYLDYVTNDTPLIFTATAPVDTNTQPFPGWSSTDAIETGDMVSFAVTNFVSASPLLIAHYTFDNSGDLGQDSSGHGFDLDYNGGNGVRSTNAAMAGSGAAYFDGGSFFSYTATPSNVLSALAGDFSLCFWINTAQNDGNEGGEAWAGAGIVAADVPGQHYDLVPAALDGGQIGFNTGPNDDTLNSVTNINDGNYHHVVVTRNQATGEKQIYIDGMLSDFDFDTMNPLSDPRIVAVGCAVDASQSNPNNANPSQYFQGLLDDIQLYSGVLSSFQVAQLFAHPGSTNAPGPDFNAALNTTNLAWTTGGDASWFVETTNTQDGLSAAQSGSVTNEQSSTLALAVTGPGTIAFYWSSIANDPNGGFDYEFYVDDPSTGDEADLYGDNAWSQEGPFTIAAGPHTLNWTVFANGDTLPTQAGFLDQVSYLPATPPVITLSPFSQTNYPGYPVWLSANATGNPAPTWQWYEVGSGAISGATSTSCLPTNAGAAAVAGSYYAVAVNLAGSATTLTAAVTFVSAPLPPSWSHALKSPFAAVDSSTITKDFYAGCAVDAAGDVYAAAQYIGNVNVLTNSFVENTLTAVGTDGAAALVKHDANGNPLWAVGLTNNDPASSSYSLCVAAAPGDGAYLASVLVGANWLGTNQFSNNGTESILLSRFDANGSNLWSRLMGSTNTVFNGYNTLVSDAAGNVTLAGLMSGTVNLGTTNLTAPSGLMGFLARFNSNGVALWGQVFSGFPLNLADGGAQIYLAFQAAASGGVTNISLGGLSNLTDRAYGFAALDAASGQPLWLRGVGERYGANDNGYGLLDDIPLISVAGSDLFLTGTAYGSTALFSNLTVYLTGGRGQYFARYDTNGNAQVAAAYGGPTTMPWASAANATGVYVSGDFDRYSYFGNDLIAAPVLAQNDLGPGYFTQPFVAKFDRNGNPLWARNGVSSDLANFRGIAAATDGVWASGFLKITNAIPAQFGACSVESDDYIVHAGSYAFLYWTQGGLLAKITEPPVATAVTLLNPQTAAANFQFQFLSQAGFTHSVLYQTNLAAANWLTYSNLTGDGTLKTIPVPLSLFSPSKEGFVRVSTQ